MGSISEHGEGEEKENLKRGDQPSLDFCKFFDRAFMSNNTANKKMENVCRVGLGTFFHKLNEACISLLFYSLVHVLLSSSM